MTEDELDLVETEKLIAALKRRNELLIVIGMNPKNITQSDFMMSINGNKLAAMAMLQIATDRLTANMYLEFDSVFDGNL